jgi:hypothetical protein
VEVQTIDSDAKLHAADGGCCFQARGHGCERHLGVSPWSLKIIMFINLSGELVVSSSFPQPCFIEMKMCLILPARYCLKALQQRLGSLATAVRIEIHGSACTLLWFFVPTNYSYHYF